MDPPKRAKYTIDEDLAHPWRCNHITTSYGRVILDLSLLQQYKDIPHNCDGVQMVRFEIQKPGLCAFR